MDQDKQQDKNSGAESLDLSKILLPKKDAPSVDSAQRVNAGALFAQEQNATLRPSQDNSSASAGGVSSAAGGGDSSGAKSAYPQSAGIAGGSGAEAVQPLQTYQSDIASVVQQGASVVSIAAAEAERRGASSLADVPVGLPQKTPLSLRTLIFVALGLVLIAVAGGLVWYIISFNTPAPLQTQMPSTFVETDGTSVVTVPQNATAAQMMQQLTSAKDAVSLSLGLVGQLYVQRAATSTSAPATYITAGELLGALAPSLPDTFLRTVAPVYVLGVHSFGKNQPFLILKVDSYEQAYAGMLAWESTMHQDLSPLFAYTPAPKIPPVQAIQTPPASTTASTTVAATSTAPAPVVFVPSGFADKIVANHDARVLQNADGSIYFLWTFLDRQTIAITTNQDTLREVIVRLLEAPIQALPTQ